VILSKKAICGQGFAKNLLKMLMYLMYTPLFRRFFAKPWRASGLIDVQTPPTPGPSLHIKNIWREGESKIKAADNKNFPLPPYKKHMEGRGIEDQGC
jgi:hypothetical protein